MKKSTFLALVVLASIGFCSCSEDSNMSSSPTPDQEDCLAGDTLWALSGDHFELILYNEILDGGYIWIFTDEFRSTMVELIDYSMIAVNPDPYLFGGPVNEIYEYKAVRPGITCASLKLARPFAEDDPPIETKNIVVIIER